MGRVLSMSPLTCVVAVRWSGVSSNRNADSSCFCHGVSGTCGGRVAIFRRAYRSSSSTVISRIAARVLSRCAAHRFPPRRCRRGGGESVGDVVAGAIALELIDAVQRHVEPIAALVLDDRDLDRALSDEDRLDAAIDPDAVLEVHDVVAVLERHRVERRGAADVAPRTTNATLAAEDLVIGENPQTGALPTRRRDAESRRRARRSTAPPATDPCSRRSAARRDARPAPRCRRG